MWKWPGHPPSPVVWPPLPVLRGEGWGAESDERKSLQGTLLRAASWPQSGRAVCVMFLDIRGFTAFSESRSATAVMAYLNTLFSPMIVVVNAEGGIINKFLG